MNPYREGENQLRTLQYKKNDSIERRLFEMNSALSRLESEPERGVDYPTVFILGLPRSGTTLLYQLIAQCLNLGYVNNLIARFWLRPEYGIALSQAVLEPLQEANYQSDFGKTKGPHGPHEFSYFWHHWLKIKDVDDMITYDCRNSKIDWSGLGRMVRCMQSMFESGLVMKGMFALNHMRAFGEILTMPLFVYVERDLFDVALSLLAARRAYYGRADTWWSLYPPNYYELKKLSFDQQIAGQVHSLKETHERMMKLVPPEVIVRVDYGRICETPGSIVEQVRGRIRDIHGVNIDTRLAPPKRLAVKAQTGALDEEQEAVLAAVAEWAGP